MQSVLLTSMIWNFSETALKKDYKAIVTKAIDDYFNTQTLLK
jgi:hypothetical protein